MPVASASLRNQQACGERVLRADGPHTGETFEQWEQRVRGDSTGWLAERSAMRNELQRLCDLWMERGYIAMPKDGKPRIIYEHCRGVIAYWKVRFAALLGVAMPPGWMRTVAGFDALWKRAMHDLEKCKADSGVRMKRHIMKLQYKDAVELAEECLSSAHKAGPLKEKYKLMLALQNLTYGLKGPRAQKLLVNQTFSLSLFYSEFGAGTGFTGELFRYNPCERNPPAIDIEHIPKMGVSHEPLMLIPGRIFCLCPIVASGLLRIVQYGENFYHMCPPTFQPGATTPDWPSLNTSVTSISTPTAQLDMTVLTELAKSLDLATLGGILSQLRHLNRLEKTADPGCSVDLVNRALQQGRTKVPEAVYATAHADVALEHAHYKGKDPRIDAYLCAITELFQEEHESELTEMCLSLLSTGFRASYASYLNSDRTGVARNYFETIFFSIKVVLIRSRCRMCSPDFRIYADSPTPFDTFQLLGDMLFPVLKHPFLSVIDAVVARHEQREIDLGINATFGAEMLQSMDASYRANMAGVSSLLAQQTANVCGYTQPDLDSLEEEREAGLISEETYQHRLAHAKARFSGGSIEEQITMRLSPAGYAARHGLPMEMAEQRRRVEDLLEQRREVYYPNGFYDTFDEDSYNRFDTGRKRDREGTPKPLPSTSPALAPPRPTAPAAPAAPTAPPAASPPAPAPLALHELPLNEFQMRAKLALSKLGSGGKVGEVVAVYVHGVLPFELDGRDTGWPALNVKQRGARHLMRSILYRALSLTVNDAGEPQPDRLAYELYALALSTNKQSWAKEIAGTPLQESMASFVFGGGTARSPIYETARANLARMKAGIPRSGATFPEPSAAPAPARPPPNPTERFFVACDPGISHSHFGVARLFVVRTTIVRIDYTSFHMPRLPDGKHVDFNVSGKRMTFLRQNLQPIISGAHGCFIEDYRANPTTIKGCDTNFFCRAVPIQLAYESGAPAEPVENKSWQAVFGFDENTRRSRLFDALCSPDFAHDTSASAIKQLDIIDAICIGLFALQKRGFSIAVRCLERMR